MKMLFGTKYFVCAWKMLLLDTIICMFKKHAFFCTIVHPSQGLLGHFSVRVTMLMLLNGTTPPLLKLILPRVNVWQVNARQLTVRAKNMLFVHNIFCWYTKYSVSTRNKMSLHKTFCLSKIFAVWAQNLCLYKKHAICAENIWLVQDIYYLCTNILFI